MARIPNIRRIYGHPWREGTLANAGKVSACVQVGVRPQTTLIAHKTMFGAPAKTSAPRACLAGIGRVDVLDRDARSARLVFDEGLQLSKAPPMESGAHPPAAVDPASDVRQVLHRDLADPCSFSLGHNGLARFVIDMLHAPPLSAGDPPELLPCALAAVGLKAATQGKVSLAPMAQRLTAKDLARTGGGEGVFSDVHAHHRAGWPQRRIVGFHDEVEVPHCFPQDQFRFLRLPRCKESLLMRPEPQRHTHPPVEGVEPEIAFSERVGALIEVNAGSLEADLGDRAVLADFPERALRPVCLANREDRVTTHLTSQGCRLTQHRVGALMERDAVPHSMRAYDRHKAVARIGVRRTQDAQLVRLCCGDSQSYRGRSQHPSALPSYMRRALDSASDRLRAHIPGRIKQPARGCLFERRPRINDANSILCFYTGQGPRGTSDYPRAAVIPSADEPAGFLAGSL